MKGGSRIFDVTLESNMTAAMSSSMRKVRFLYGLHCASAAFLGESLSNPSG